MSEKNTVREQMTEAYEKTQKQDQKRKTDKEIELKEVDLNKASPFMLMKLGFQKLLEQDQKENLDD
jgi:hypothetical protein